MKNRFFIIIITIIMIIIPATVLAAPSLDFVNQKVCDRFEEDISRLAGIMDELRNRKGITQTRVAYGGIDDQIKLADYQVTFAAEAIAYQRYQKFSSVSELRGSLEVVREKVLRAKTEVGKAIE